jgi:PKD repeat protein
MRAMIWLAVAVAGAGLVTACDNTKPGENDAPTADFTFVCSALQCDFQDASHDDVEVTKWSWNFGVEGSNLRNPVYGFGSAGSYPVTLTVTDGDGMTGVITKNVDPKDPVITSLTCANPTVQGGFVACTLKLQSEAGFKVVLDNSSCEAHGNLFRVTAPQAATLTSDGCYEQDGKELLVSGPFPAGTEISAEVVAPLLANPPSLRVSGDYPVWHLTFEDGYDTDFNDLEMTLTALPTGN